MSDKRKIIASGSIRIKDDEIFSDEYGDLTLTSTGVVSPDQPSVTLVKVSQCVGGEVRCEVELDAEYENNGDARISGEVRLFEGTSCSTTDLEDTQNINLLTPKDGVASIDVDTMASGGDYAKGKIRFSNTAQPVQ